MHEYFILFKLDHDVRCLFPYINSVIPDARYFDQPESIQFLFDDIQSTLYPLEVVAAPFLDKNQALTFFSRMVDFLNDLHNKRKDLQPDHRTYRPLSVIDVLLLLPKSNCGSVGIQPVWPLPLLCARERACPIFAQDFPSRSTKMPYIQFLIGTAVWPPPSPLKLIRPNDIMPLARPVDRQPLPCPAPYR